MNTLRPKASAMRVKSPFDCVQAAHEKKFKMKIPINSASTDFHRLAAGDFSSLAPKLYFAVIVT